MKTTSFPSRLRAWLNNVPIQDPIEHRIASLLQVILIGLMGIVLLVTLVIIAVPSLSVQEKVDVLINVFLGFLVVVFPLGLLRRGYIRGSLWLMIAILFITPTLTITVIFDLLRNRGILVLYTLALILAGLLVSRRALVLTFGLSAVVVGFSAFQVPGASQEGSDALPTALNFILFHGLIALFLDRFGVTLRATLASSLENEKLLQNEINERREAEEQLRQSEQYYRMLTKSQMDFIVHMDRDGRIQYINRLPEGHTMDMVRGASTFDFLPPDTHEITRKALNKVFDAGEPFVYEFREQSASTSIGWYLTRIIPVNDQEQTIGAILISTDITKRKQVEEAFRESERRFRDMLENIELLAVLLDLEGKVTFCNEYLLKLTGYRRDEVLGQDWLAQFVPGDRTDVRELFFQGIQHGEIATYYENPILTKNWEQRIIRFSNTILRDNEGNVIGTTSIGEDITERKQAEQALQEAQKHLVLAIRSANVGLWDWDLKTNNIFYSAEWKSQLGYELHEISDDFSEWESRVHPSDLERAKKIISAYIENPYPNYQNEFRMRHKNGSYRWILAQASLLFDEQGKPNRMMGSHIDITKRKQAEEALHESEIRFRNIIDASPVPCALNDERQNITYLNPAFIRAFGYEINDIPTLADWWPRAYPDPEYRQWVAETWQERLDKAKRTGALFEPVELNIHCKDGAIRTVIVGASSLAGSFEGVHLVTLFDITERKQAEEKLERQNERLKALREIDTAILAADSVESIVGAALSHIRELIDCHRAHMTIFDWGTNDAVIFNVSANNESFYPEGTHVPLTPFQDLIQALSKNQPILIDDLTTLPNPSPLFNSLIREGFRSVCILPLFSQGNLIGTFNISSEISEFFNEEKIGLGREVANQVAIAITQSNLLEELRNLNANLEQRVQERTVELEDANKELDAFSYSVSHDLRTPLRAIDGYAGLLAEQYITHLPAEAHRYIANLRASSKRMTQLIEDLLTLSRVTRTPLRRVSVDLSQLAHGITSELILAVPERSIEFVIADKLTVSGDPGLLQIVMENLLNNAWKYTSKRGQAYIEFGERSQVDKERIFFVRDNGIGFEVAYADQLFGAFQRLHTEAEFEGTGIGLATVQRIIHRHGGRIWAEAEPDRGATFYFTISRVGD